MAISLRCPECDAVLKLASRPAEGKKVKCSKCSTAFVASDNEVSAAVKAGPAAARKRPRRDDDDDDDDGRSRSVAKKKAGSKTGLYIGLGVLAVALLGCLVLVPLGAFFWFVAAVPVRVAQGGDKIKPADDAVMAVPIGPGGNVPAVNLKNFPAELDKQLLDKTARATALVRVEMGNQKASGSAFLVKSNGDTGYLITNFHVIAMEKEEPAPVNPGPGGKGGPKGGPKDFGKEKFPFKKGPGGPFGKGGPFGAPAKEVTARGVRVNVVFNSGTPQEQSLPAEIVAVDQESDLAALRVTGARNLPEAIEVPQDAAVAETMPVYIFGFPANKMPPVGNPTVNVEKGTIAGLRRDVNNELTDVHINGELNPGNSGGPVVDTKGRLIGIAVATVPGKQIGFAIPTGELNQMFKGRLAMAWVVQIRQQGTRLDGESWVHDRKSSIRAREAVSVPLTVPGPQSPPDEFMVLARLADPMLKINAVSAHFAVTEKAPIKGPQGWDKIANAQPVALKMLDQFAQGTFKLPNGAVADQTFAFQFSYVNADGQTIFTQPHSVRLTFPKNPQSVTINVTAIPDLPTVRYIEDSAPGLFPGKVSVKARTNDSLVIEIDPVADPTAIEQQISFGQVTKVEGRTFAVTAKKLPLPAPTDEAVNAALDNLKSPNEQQKIQGADQLGKVYVILPARQKEVAKALEPHATNKNIWLAKASLRGLTMWGGPENTAAVAPALDSTWTSGEAIDALASFKDPAAATAVAKMLTGLGTRTQAGGALRTMGPMAEKAVITYVSHTDGFTARAACDVLKDIGTADCVPALTTASNSKNFFLATGARDALKSVQARIKK